MEENSLMVFNNKLLWGILGARRKDEAGGWRKFLKEDLHNLYC
jgi:hypothetical protein